MAKTRHRRRSLLYFLRHVYIVVGLVLVWRGVWYVLDGVDKWLLGDSHVWTALLGIVAGVLVLFLPDHDLKEIEKL